MTTKRDPFKLTAKDMENEKLISFLQRADEMHQEAIRRERPTVQIW